MNKIINIIKNTGQENFITEDDRNDFSLMEYLIENISGDFIKYIGPELKKSKELALKALNNLGDYKLLPKEMQLNEKVVMEAIRIDDTVFKKIPDNLKNNPKIYQIAISQESKYFKLLSQEIQDSKVIVLQCIEINPNLLFDLPYLYKSDRDVVLQALMGDADTQRFCEIEEIKNNPNYFIEYLQTLENNIGFNDILNRCANNQNFKTKLFIANHPDFLPTTDQIEIGLESRKALKEVYQLRKDEWLAKIEENKLKNNIAS